MNEHNFPYESFIGGWYIPENICDEIVKYFNEQKQKGNTGPGVVGSYKSESVKDSVKVSEDCSISSNNFDYPLNEYREYLQSCLIKYTNRYDKINELTHFNINSDYNIQFYNKGEGFKIYHCERGGSKRSLSKVLAFMTYLNNVDDGGTEFKYQNITTPAKKGLTLIWPTHWTHTHRGQVSNTKTKYITTGWFDFYE